MTIITVTVVRVLENNKIEMQFVLLHFALLSINTRLIQSMFDVIQVQSVS